MICAAQLRLLNFRRQAPIYLCSAAIVVPQSNL